MVPSLTGRSRDGERLIASRAVTQKDVLKAVARAGAAVERTVDSEGNKLAPSIDGVMMRRLQPHVDHRGALAVFMDTRDPFWAEPVVYAYEITVAARRIKGWGMHKLQTDRYYVATGDVRVALYDGREDSPTAGAMVEVMFTDQTPGLLAIPPGVWHADQNWGETVARIVNFPTRAYNPDEPDKFHIDPHAGIIPFDWALHDA
jgi:dTDP-4-dehydrorhamnose 3,5-epimerase